MKNIFKLFTLIIVLFISGCSKDKYITCINEINNKENNYKLNATYKIYYKDSYVTKIEKEETYKSSEEDIVEYFNEYKRLEYDNLNKLYNGYTFNIESRDNYLYIKTNIDMSLTSVKKMVKDGYLNEDYAIGNKLTISGAKYFYKDKGANCDI